METCNLQLEILFQFFKGKKMELFSSFFGKVIAGKKDF